MHVCTHVFVIQTYVPLATGVQPRFRGISHVPRRVRVGEDGPMVHGLGSGLGLRAEGLGSGFGLANLGGRVNGS